ncbi:hypothetical protein LCGC14_0254000 [marine sediment metagenome]|uniref:Cytochrome c assembly protein domain-containing protein n=1 Tax=marine sediment metagenome TaxID=412755 RepID=A0A0F9U8F5_9ZZZZ|nr:hypothetical protein [Phycisphaerae bacterium]HDZ44691.1 hypothetical protein [Phycisphaerae bacterium]
MDILFKVAEWLLPLLYMGLVIDYGVTFFLRIRTHVHNGWIPVIILFHAAFLVVRSIHLGQPPLFNGYEILSVIALSTTAVYYIVELVGHDRRTGLFVFLIVFLAQYTSSVFLANTAIEPTTPAVAGQGWRSLHSLAATFAYTALALAGVYGALHLIGRRNLKRHNIGLLFDRLPPLELLGRTCWYAIIGGLVFMTISVVTGALVYGRGAGGPDAEAMSAKIIAKIVVGSVTWLVCVVAVLGKGVGKWSDSRVCLVAAGGFLTVAILFVASLALS